MKNRSLKRVMGSNLREKYGLHLTPAGIVCNVLAAMAVDK